MAIVYKKEIKLQKILNFALRWFYIFYLWAYNKNNKSLMSKYWEINRIMALNTGYLIQPKIWSYSFIFFSFFISLPSHCVQPCPQISWYQSSYLFLPLEFQSPSSHFRLSVSHTWTFLFQCLYHYSNIMSKIPFWLYRCPKASWPFLLQNNVNNLSYKNNNHIQNVRQSSQVLEIKCWAKQCVNLITYMLNIISYDS